MSHYWQKYSKFSFENILNLHSGLETWRPIAHRSADNIDPEKLAFILHAQMKLSREIYVFLGHSILFHFIPVTSL